MFHNSIDTVNFGSGTQQTFIGSSAYSPVWEPGGDRLAYAFAGNAYIKNTKTGFISSVISDSSRQTIAY